MFISYRCHNISCCTLSEARGNTSDCLVPSIYQDLIACVLLITLGSRLGLLSTSEPIHLKLPQNIQMFSFLAPNTSPKTFLRRRKFHYCCVQHFYSFFFQPHDICFLEKGANATVYCTAFFFLSFFSPQNVGKVSPRRLTLVLAENRAFPLARPRISATPSKCISCTSSIVLFFLFRRMR